MKFIDDARKQFPRLWSVRLTLLAAVASAIETGVHLYATGTAPLLVIGSFFASIGAAIARIVAQPSVTGE